MPTNLNTILANSTTALEFTLSALRKLRNSSHTAFEVYPTNVAIPVGQHVVLGQVSQVINPNMMEKFVLCSILPAAKSDVSVDWGDGTIETISKGYYASETGPDESGIYRITMAHTYATMNKYIVRIYGRNYFNLKHTTDCSNIISRVFDKDLSVASHLVDFNNFCANGDRITSVKILSRTFLHKVVDASNMFSNCKNLLSATGFENNLINVMNIAGMFSGDANLTTCDMSCPTSHFGKDGIVNVFNGCSKLSIDVGSFFHRYFGGENHSVDGIFNGCTSLTGTVPAEKLWLDKDAHWTDTTTCFNGCPAEILAQIPTSWGGTAPDPEDAPVTIVTEGNITGDGTSENPVKMKQEMTFNGDTSVDVTDGAFIISATGLTLNGKGLNTAGGLVTTDEDTGKLRKSMLPNDLTIATDGNIIGDGTSENPVKMKQEMTFNGDTSINVTNGAFAVSANGLTFNGKGLNTAGGLITADENTGKLRKSMLPDDLTIVTEGNIIGDGSSENPIKMKQEMTFNGNASINVTDGALAVNANGLTLNGKGLNTAGGLVTTDENTGKIKKSMLPDSGPTLTAVTTEGNIIGDGTSENPVKMKQEMTFNGDTSINITDGAFIINANGLTFNGKGLNTAGGLITADENTGKLRKSMLPDDLSIQDVTYEVVTTATTKTLEKFYHYVLKGVLTGTLPEGVDNDFVRITIKEDGMGSTITPPSGKTIDGNTSLTLDTTGTVTLLLHGNDWIVLP